MQKAQYTEDNSILSPLDDQILKNNSILTAIVTMATLLAVLAVLIYMSTRHEMSAPAGPGLDNSAYLLLASGAGNGTILMENGNDTTPSTYNHTSGNITPPAATWNHTSGDPPPSSNTWNHQSGDPGPSSSTWNHTSESPPPSSDTWNHTSGNQTTPPNSGNQTSPSTH